MISESKPIGKRTVERHKKITIKINKQLFFYLIKKNQYILATNPVRRPYSIVVDGEYCEAIRRRTVNVRRPIAPIARPNDMSHTERIWCGIKHFWLLEFDDDAVVMHISIRPIDVSPKSN